jgi:hypothetical protein
MEELYHLHDMVGFRDRVCGWVDRHWRRRRQGLPLAVVVVGKVGTLGEWGLEICLMDADKGMQAVPNTLLLAFFHRWRMPATAQ